MTEQLFKLKKDGKCVGYLKIKDGFIYGSPDCINWSCIIEQNPAGDLRLLNNQWIEFYDTAHPFVTTDKNGDKVFAFDMCIGNLRDGGTIKGEVITDGSDSFRMPVAPYIEDDEGEQRYLTECWDIELIKDKS